MPRLSDWRRFCPPPARSRGGQCRHPRAPAAGSTLPCAAVLGERRLPAPAWPARTTSRSTLFIVDPMTTKSVDLPHLRSVVLAGHAGAGKTTLGEQLLFESGAVGRVGKVDDGSSHLDFEPEEQKRRESLSLAVATFETDGTRVTLVDTPGYLDFVGRGRLGLRGGRRRDPRHGRLGRRRGRSRAGRRLGREHQHRGLLLHQQVRPGERGPPRPRSMRCGPRSATRSRRSRSRSARPRRSRATSTSSTARRTRFEGGKEVEIPIPDGMADEVARRRDQLLEAAAEADDDVLTKYLEGEEVADAELEACLRKGVKESILAPVLVGSRGDGIGLAGAARRDRPLPPLPRGRGPGQGARQGRRARSRSRRTRTGRSSRASSRRPRTRSSAGSPTSACSRARSTPRPTSGTRSATRRSASASCCCSTARSRSRSASSRPARSGRSRS